MKLARSIGRSCAVIPNWAGTCSGGRVLMCSSSFSIISRLATDRAVPAAALVRHAGDQHAVHPELAVEPLASCPLFLWYFLKSKLGMSLSPLLMGALSAAPHRPPVTLVRFPPLLTRETRRQQKVVPVAFQVCRRADDVSNSTWPMFLASTQPSEVTTSSAMVGRVHSSPRIYPTMAVILPDMPGNRLGCSLFVSVGMVIRGAAESRSNSEACAGTEAAPLPVRFPPHDDVGSQEAFHVEVPTQFLRVPDLPVLGFQCLAAAGLGV